MNFMSRRLTFWTFGTAFALFLFAAAAPSPLYGLYALRWGFSSLEVTEVFAVYAIVLLAALLLTGSLSDAVGRKPVVLAALVIQIVSMGAFIAASGAGWLFAARSLQGLATGLATGALAAALVDLQPRERPGLAPLVNSVAPICGLALGALLSAALVQLGPDPMRLVYGILAVVFAVLVLVIFAAPEPASLSGQPSLRPRVGVSAEARPAFLAALPTLIAGWGVGGFYFSLGPSLASELSGSRDRLIGGALLFTLAGVGALVVLALSRWEPRTLMTLGVLALIIGLGVTVLALTSLSLAALFAGTAITGVGFGIAWLGVLRTLIALAPAASRGALLAAIYIVAYLAFAVPAVIAGYLVTRAGLHDASVWYAGAMDLLAVAGLAGTVLVGRPART